MSLLARVKDRNGGVDVSDTELQHMIDGLQAEIDTIYGPASDLVTVFDRTGQLNTVTLVRLVNPADPNGTITVTEMYLGTTDDQTVLSADDFRLTHKGTILERLSDGTNPATYWSPLVKVEYTPIANTSILREEAVIKLMGLELSSKEGIKKQTKGNWSEEYTTENYKRRRQEIIRSISPTRLVLA